ncbi:MAG: DUF3467 domain-containing protein [Actinobacteria bacterium]|nr:DUF3467 domain-containing protein [Actinomycetota bacterium]
MAQQEIKVKVPDDMLRGVYANQMMVTHTKEEFLMDFINFFPPEGVVTARVIVSPGHLRRIVTALQENIAKYETNYGPIEESTDIQVERPQFRVN